MQSVIVTVTAADAVGILAAVSGAITHLEGSIDELSQTVLRGYFTIILAARFPDRLAIPAIRQRITEAGRQFGLEVCVQPARATPESRPAGRSERFIITVQGQDRPGIVQAITQHLAARGVNITDCYATIQGPEFVMILEVHLPSDEPAAQIRADLEHLGQAIQLTAQIQHENIFIATNEPRAVRSEASGGRQPPVGAGGTGR